MLLKIYTSQHCRFSVFTSLGNTSCKLNGAFCASICASLASNLAFSSPPNKYAGRAHLNTCQPQLILTAKQSITLNLTHNCRFWRIAQCCTALCVLPKLDRPLRRSFFVALLFMSERVSGNVHQSCFNYCTIETAVRHDSHIF